MCRAEAELESRQRHRDQREHLPLLERCFKVAMEELEELEQVLEETMLQLVVLVADLEEVWQQLLQQPQMVELVELP